MHSIHNFTIFNATSYPTPQHQLLLRVVQIIARIIKILIYRILTAIVINMSAESFNAKINALKLGLGSAAANDDGDDGGEN